MARNKGSTKKYADLRKRAEAMMMPKEDIKKPIAPEEARKLIHELHTYQIELELQNEELLRTQQELQKSYHRYTDLYDFAPVGYVTISDKGLILEANLTIADMLTVERRFLIKQPLSKFIFNEDQDIYYQKCRVLLKANEQQTCELRMQKKDGTLFHAQLKSVIILEVDGVSGQYRTVITDISGRKIAEEKLHQAHDKLEQRVIERTKELKTTHDQLVHAEKLSAIGTLAASVAHEFNNPLFGIHNVLGGIKQRASLDEDDRELIDMALLECERIKHLIQDLQDFNRPSSQNLAPMDMHMAINSIIMLLKSIFKTKKITFTKHFAPEMPIIMAVGDQIKQVLLNLLHNAVDAIPKQGGTITLTTEVREKKVAIHIQDSGVGIKQENMARIYEPFYTTKPAVKGTGLGLSVSHGIIKKHRGIIEVHSDEGKGTTFSIIFPIEGEA